MTIIQVLSYLVMTSVAAEFGLHLWYFWKSGGDAGIYAPAFDYLKNINQLIEKGGKHKRV